MKLLHLFLLLSCTLSYSQGFCEYGDYDFLFNIIKGVDKVKFKKVELKNKTNSLYIENYDDDGKLINSNYNETIGGYLVSVDNPCYSIDEDEIEQKKNEYQYEYFKTGKLKRVNVLLDKKVKKIATYKYLDSLNILKTIEAKKLRIIHQYYNNGLLKSINRNYKMYHFDWNSNKKLKKIIIIPTDYSYDEYLFFKYNSDQTINTITTEFYDKVTKNKTTETEKSFCYKDKKLQKIVLTGFELTKNKKEKIDPIFYEFNYDNNDKLIINVLDNDKKYIEHFECYY